ncbi:MAG: transcriptional regulator, partial [Firmicutes bacterium]|nr:transcriptional regulator [Bacillota bacterium]
STLLGETVVPPSTDDLKTVCEKLEVINLNFARSKLRKQKIIHWSCAVLSAVIVLVFAVMIVLSSPYLDWDYSAPETAVIGVGFHTFEWLFVRTAPFALICTVVGFLLTHKKL